jgi:hypothetical protein
LRRRISRSRKRMMRSRRRTKIRSKEGGRQVGGKGGVGEHKEKEDQQKERRRSRRIQKGGYRGRQ